MDEDNLSTTDTGLVGAETCLKNLFPDSGTRPSLRTFHEWKARGFIPYRKIGGRVFYDPPEVRRAIDRQFKIKETSFG